MSHDNGLDLIGGELRHVVQKLAEHIVYGRVESPFYSLSLLLKTECLFVKVRALVSENNVAMMYCL